MDELKKFWNKIKKFAKRKRGYADGIYLGFLIALLLFTLSNSLFGYIRWSEISKINEVFYVLNKVYAEEYDIDEVKEGIYKGIVNKLDGFSSYMTREEYDSFSSAEDNNYCGIGVQWQIFEDLYTIVEVFEDSPAEEAGLKKGDILWGVNGNFCKTMTSEELSAEVRGLEGTSVDMIIVRNNEEIELTVVRRPIQRKIARLKIYDNVGVIDIDSFDGTVVEDFSECVEQLNKENITNLIIDLRNNTGGSVEILGTLMQDIVDTNAHIFNLVRKDGSTVEYSLKSHTDKHYNILILVNNATASASETMAGSLRDLGLAKLVGTQTYGKGVIQDSVVLSDESVLNITSGHCYLPNGEMITKDGLTPDIIIEDDTKTLADEQLEYTLTLFEK